MSQINSWLCSISKTATCPTAPNETELDRDTSPHNTGLTGDRQAAGSARLISRKNVRFASHKAEMLPGLWQLAAALWNGKWLSGRDGFRASLRLTQGKHRQLPARRGLESWVWRKGPRCQRKKREDSTWKMVRNAKYKVMQEETQSCSSETPAWVCPAQQSALATELSPQQHNLRAAPHVLAAGCIPSLLWSVLLKTSEWHRVEGCCRHSLLNLLSSTIIIFFGCNFS